MRGARAETPRRLFSLVVPMILIAGILAVPIEPRLGKIAHISYDRSLVAEIRSAVPPGPYGRSVRCQVRFDDLEVMVLRNNTHSCTPFPRHGKAL
jgi:hypothetical protein